MIKCLYREYSVCRFCRMQIAMWRNLSDGFWNEIPRLRSTDYVGANYTGWEHNFESIWHISLNVLFKVSAFVLCVVRRAKPATSCHFYSFNRIEKSTLDFINVFFFISFWFLLSTYCFCACVSMCVRNSFLNIPFYHDFFFRFLNSNCSFVFFGYKERP